MSLENVKTPSSFPLPKSIQFVISQLKSNYDLKAHQIRKIILEANVQAEELSPWADFEHSPTDSYGRKLVYECPNYEIMVMSWLPGDFSAIHDHGSTQWGAVQTFGAAEHATFRVENHQIHTLKRWILRPGEVISVHADLIHQMGNSSKSEPFLSLHVYGSQEAQANITGDARLFDLKNHHIQLVNGGAFLALPQNEINSIQDGPTGDLPTWLRYMTELALRKYRIGMDLSSIESELKSIFSVNVRTELLEFLAHITDDKDHNTDSVQWQTLKQEFLRAYELQKLIKQHNLTTADQFHKYADWYDALIGVPCWESFIQPYLLFFQNQYAIDFEQIKLLSLGCGTGLVEEHLIQNFKVSYQNLLGIDISEGMIQKARTRINAILGDLLELEAETESFDITFSGLNVFHYLPHHKFEEAVQKAAQFTQMGGFFVGDFITPDHIRWYPNVMISKDQKIISLRSPQLIEKEGILFQESEILNLNFQGDKMEINYAGKHLRFLPPLNRVRNYFENYFRKVDLYDVKSLKLIDEKADSCPSTRYFVVAKK